MQTIKKSLCILLVLMLSLGFTVSAESTEGIGISPLWTDITVISNNFNVDSGVASTIVDVTAKANITSIKISCVIQKRSLLLFWSDFATISARSYSGRYATFSDKRNIGSGSFRIKITVTVYQNGIEQESVTVYSEG